MFKKNNDNFSDKEILNIEINKSFFDQIHNIMNWQGKEPETLLHLRNALELYATVIEGMSEGKTPLLGNSNGRTAENLQLPLLLEQFKNELENNSQRKINFKKDII